MKKFKDKLELDIRRGWPSVHKPAVAMPDNGIKVKLRFNKPLVADVVGDTAKHLLRVADYNSQLPSSSSSSATASATTVLPTPLPMAITLPSSAILVSENFVSTIVGASELPTYTSCRLGKITQVRFCSFRYHHR